MELSGLELPGAGLRSLEPTMEALALRGKTTLALPHLVAWRVADTTEKAQTGRVWQRREDARSG